MSLAEYLAELQAVGQIGVQARWYARLGEQVKKGEALWVNASLEQKAIWENELQNWIRTEELKAWYGAPEDGSLFQGTSISSLTIPHELDKPLELAGVEHLEDVLAGAFIAQHDRYEHMVRGTTHDNVDKWVKEGIYYGVVVGSKVISQAFQLAVPAENVIFNVDGVMVDPHEITSYPAEIRRKYFEAIKPRIGCFRDLDLTQAELEESLVLSDISKPKLNDYRGKLILGPVRCNEICALLSRHLTALVKKKTNGRIAPRSLMVTIYDSDTPYTYHQIAGFYGHRQAPTLPGLTLLGSSGSIDAFRWLYIYRASLISQKMMKSSLYSESVKKFIPFVFFGVLVERDADILLNLDELGLLRYRGQLSPYIEFCYLLPKIASFLSLPSKQNFLENRLR